MENYAKFNADIKIVESSVTQLNPQFSLCDILVCYHGDNRNYTSMSKETINNALYSLYGVPIIGEWLYDTTEETWGSHGGKIIISDKGIQFEQTTKPYGFVTKEAADSASWVTITEDDGHTQHEYLQLKGCILWTDRYEEASSILKENFGQSMEIEIQKGTQREDGYYDVNQFVFSALCILGTAEPCFESASIGRHYEQNGFAEEINKMRKAYAKFIEEKKIKMNNDIIALLENNYSVLSISENEIIALDRSDYKLKALPYNITQDEEGNETCVINYEEASERYFTATEEANEFTIAPEIERCVNEAKAEAEAKYSELESKHNDALNMISVYEAEKAERELASHKEEVNELIESYSENLSNCTDYIVYCTNVDFNKTTEEIENDLVMMLGRYSKNKNTKKKGKAQYGVFKPDEDKPSKEYERYGNLLENV